MTIIVIVNYDDDYVALTKELSQVTCETPDIVSSCDSGEGSKRNSLELDTESLGILRLVNNRDFEISLKPKSSTPVRWVTR